jgi:DNA-binding MarR family transcriptional regulator
MTMTTHDHIDHLIDDWASTRPELEFNDVAALLRLMRLSEVLDRELAAIAAEHALKPGQFQVLAALRRRHPAMMTPTELNHAALLTSGAMTPLLDRLEQKEYVRRLPDPNDRRGVLVELTQEGQKVIDAALDARLGRLHQLSALLSRTEQDQVSGALRKLLIHLENR